MADDEERASLVKLAGRLQRIAEHGGAEFEALLSRFNEQMRAECTRSTFRSLHQSEEPEDVVDRLLEIRDAPPFVRPKTREELAALMQKAADGASYLDGERAGEALAHMSRLPYEIAHQLGSGFGELPCWPEQEEIIDFALAYEPPTPEALFALLRRWLEDLDAGRCTVYVAVMEQVLRERQAVLRIPALEGLVELLQSGIEARRAHAIRRLKTLVRP